MKPKNPLRNNKPYKQNKQHTPRKRFGQNFLKDEQIIHQIIASLNIKPDDRVVEIGPGLGALTKPLLEEVNNLEVIELDRDLAEELKSFAKEAGLTQRFTIHQADALKFDFADLFKAKNQTVNSSGAVKKLRLIGNLPYNISTPLIFHLLNYCPIIQDMHFMLQKELVDRMSATPNNKNYGRLSVMIQYSCAVTSLFSVPANAFYPAPKVTSAVVRLVPFEKPPYPAKNIQRLKQVTTAAFSQRRKTLSNSLKNFLSKDAWNALAIDPGARAEQLSVEDFVRIANYLEDLEDPKG
jgi:16S rRNA (adenine1518-N6/adenine1519-N6)-dimethyltransferase